MNNPSYLSTRSKVDNLADLTERKGKVWLLVTKLHKRGENNDTSRNATPAKFVLHVSDRRRHSRLTYDDATDLGGYAGKDLGSVV